MLLLKKTGPIDEINHYYIVTMHQAAAMFTLKTVILDHIMITETHSRV